MRTLDKAQERIEQDIERFERSLENLRIPRRRIRRDEDKIAFNRHEADLLGKIRGLKIALEHLRVAKNITDREKGVVQ